MKKAEPLPFLIASRVLLSLCYGSYFAKRIKNMHSCRAAMLLVRVSQKRRAAIFNTAHRFQASNLRLLNTRRNETHWHNRPLSSPTFYHCVNWHFHSDLTTVTWGYSSSLGRRRVWIWTEISGISGRVDLGWHCLHGTLWSIACHEQQRSMREVLAVGGAAGSHGAAA